MPTVAAAATISALDTRKRSVEVQEEFASHLYEEKKKLERQLTTQYPNQNDIIFDRVLGVLMMDG